jgi:hypothetical protein
LLEGRAGPAHDYVEDPKTIPDRDGQRRGAGRQLLLLLGQGGEDLGLNDGTLDPLTARWYEKNGWAVRSRCKLVAGGVDSKRVRVPRGALLALGGGIMNR